MQLRPDLGGVGVEPARRAQDLPQLPTESAAKGWRADATGAVRRGGMRAPSPQTVAEAVEAWIRQAEAGEIKKRGGRDYKPAVIRGYRADLRRYVVPALGGQRVSQLRRRDVQELLVDQLVAAGSSGSKVLNVLNALRAVLRPALRGDELAIDPTRGLDLPEGAGVRERAASVAEAEELLQRCPRRIARYGRRPATPACAAASCARCAGRTSTSSDNAIRVERGWDELEGEIAPKSRRARAPFRSHRRCGWSCSSTAPAPAGGLPSSSLAARPPSRSPRRISASGRFAPGLAAVGAFLRGRGPALEPIGLHELRHTYVSLMFGAGFSLERIGDYVRHSSAYMVDRYRHLLDGHEAEAAAQFGAYLERKATGAQAGRRGVKRRWSRK